MNDQKTLKAALQYHSEGWSVIQVPYGQKMLNLPGWQHLRLEAEQITDLFGGQESNVSVLPGEPSHGIVDVDLDCREAVEAAKWLLPKTKRIHGRHSNLSSHWWYYVIAALVKTMQFQDPDASGDVRAMLVEIRSTGCQTIVPPSVHPSGEELVWEEYGAPAEVDAPCLVRCVAAVAAAALMARRWVPGIRHSLAMALAGCLLKSGETEEYVTKIITCVAEIAGDEEIADRLRAVTDTARRLEAGETVTGFQLLTELIGEKSFAKVAEWLGLSRHDHSSTGFKGSATNEITHCDGLLPIETKGRHLRHISAEALNILKAANDPPYVFQFGGTLAKIEPDGDGRPCLIPLDASGLRTIFARIANWVSSSANRGVFPVAPPTMVMEDITNQGAESGFPPVDAIVTSPVVGRTGKIQTTPGYHADSRRYYFAKDQMHLPDIEPTPEAVRRALYLLECLFGDFPFKDAASRTQAYAVLLLPFVRPMIEGPSPLHIIDAPTPGTGKTLLAELISGVFVPGGASIMMEGTNEDEWRKRITSTLMNTPSFILLDNLKRRLSSGVLAGVLTAETWEDRILGLSRNARLPVRCVWLGTGNNVQIDGEIVRRTVWIRLDAGVERPSQREGFCIPDIHSWAVRHRQDLVWACLTLINVWLKAGQPRFTGKVFGSYEQWTQVMGGILEANGFAGFLDNRDELYDMSDPEHDMWGAFFAEWYERHGSYAVGVAQVIELAAGQAASLKPGHLTDLLGYGEQRSQRTKLGGLLNAQRDRIYGGYQLKLAGKKQGATQYAVYPIGNAPVRLSSD